MRVASAGLVYWVARFFLLGTKARILGLTGYLLTAAPPDLERGVAPLGPPAPTQPWLLGDGVALLGRLPDLGCGEAPLRCSFAVEAWRSGLPPLTLGEG